MLLSNSRQVTAANRWQSTTEVKPTRLESSKHFAIHSQSHWNARISCRRETHCSFGFTGNRKYLQNLHNTELSRFKMDCFLHFSVGSRIGSYSGSSINFWAHYDFFNNSQREGVKTFGTECDVVYEPATRTSGQWISPYNTMLYKRSTDSSDLKCRYTFQVTYSI